MFLSSYFDTCYIATCFLKGQTAIIWTKLQNYSQELTVMSWFAMQSFADCFKVCQAVDTNNLSHHDVKHYIWHVLWKHIVQGLLLPDYVSKLYAHKHIANSICILLRYGIAQQTPFCFHLNALSINVYFWCALKALWFIHLSTAITRKINATSTLVYRPLLQYAASYSLGM